MMGMDQRSDLRVREQMRRLAAALGLVCVLVACAPVGATDRSVRLPAVAGAFYPGDSAELGRSVDALLAQAPAPALPGRVLGLVLPHAGYVYSGALAAEGWKALVGADLDTVYLLGTSHQGAPGAAYAWSGQAFRTPLGDYPVDTAAVTALLKACPHIRLDLSVWPQEHSVEVQVPFLQRVAPRAKLVPIVMGDCPDAVVNAVARAVADQARGRRALVVASTDLSHYPAGPDARRVDQDMLKPLLALDADGLAAADRKWMTAGVSGLACTICGLSAVRTVVLSAKALGADQAKLLRYTHSGDVSGDPGRVVGYAAVALLGPAAAATTPARDNGYSPEQRSELLKLARTSIAEALRQTGAGPAPTADLPAWLREERAVFVTLKEHGDLRGCIGMTEARMPLQQAVRQMAYAAAFEDPRFPPVTSAELPKMDLEISVLTPLRRVRSANEVRMGVDGVMVRRDGRSGLFLPQVATETGWSKERFLDELCTQKAGLPPGAWRDPGTKLYVFTVESFEDHAPH